MVLAALTTLDANWLLVHSDSKSSKCGIQYRMDFWWAMADVGRFLALQGLYKQIIESCIAITIST